MAPQLNQLLAALPSEVLQRICPYLEMVALPIGEVLYEPGDGRRHVYFPVDCTVSLLQGIENGASAEVSMVGKEGIVGISAFMGGDYCQWRAVVQNAGFAYRLLGHKLNDEFSRHGDMLRLMLRYTQLQIVQMSQTAACNRHHSIDQQVCRWLLQSLDRLPSSTITVTQESLANALGVRREGVTLAAGKLCKLGVIEYGRGKITVVNRARLESLSCECYAVVKKESNRLLPAVQQPLTTSGWTRARFEPAMNKALTMQGVDRLAAA